VIYMYMNIYADTRHRHKTPYTDISAVRYQIPVTTYHMSIVTTENRYQIPDTTYQIPAQENRNREQVQLAVKRLTFNNY
jgi:hypothetical protein